MIANRPLAPRDSRLRPRLARTNLHTRRPERDPCPAESFNSPIAATVSPSPRAAIPRPAWHIILSQRRESPRSIRSSPSDSCSSVHHDASTRLPGRGPPLDSQGRSRSAPETSTYSESRNPCSRSPSRRTHLPLESLPSPHRPQPSQSVHPPSPWARSRPSNRQHGKRKKSSLHTLVPRIKLSIGKQIVPRNVSQPMVYKNGSLQKTTSPQARSVSIRPVTHRPYISQTPNGSFPALSRRQRMRLIRIRRVIPHRHQRPLRHLAHPPPPLRLRTRHAPQIPAEEILTQRKVILKLNLRRLRQRPFCKLVPLHHVASEQLRRHRRPRSSRLQIPLPAAPPNRPKDPPKKNLVPHAQSSTPSLSLQIGLPSYRVHSFMTTDSSAPHPAPASARPYPESSPHHPHPLPRSISPTRQR